jgi:hypothetical protein
MMNLAYEFVEAFSSVPPKVRISQVLGVLGIIVDLIWRVATGNLLHPDFIDIPAAILVGFYLGKRPRGSKSDDSKKPKWIRLSKPT